MKEVTIAFTGGGTAGHVIPNLPLIEGLESLNYKTIYIGSHQGPEKSLVKTQFFGIRSGKLRRYFSFQNVWDVFNVLMGTVQALIILKQSNSKVLFSKGGFVSVPVVLAAKCLGIPIIIHESDRSPGLANRISIPFASTICYAFPNTNGPDHKSILTGIPIKIDTTLTQSNAKKKLGLHSRPVILVMGGTQGAKVINDAIQEILDELLEHFQVIHCHGEAYEPQVDHPNYYPHPFIKEGISDVLMASDLVISRAGATSCFEIMAAQKNNILIPLSKAVSRGDQIENAAYFESLGLSTVIQESQLNSSILSKQINSKLTQTSSFEGNKIEVLESTKKIINIIQSKLPES